MFKFNLKGSIFKAIFLYRFIFIFGVLTPLSAIFQLYHGDQFWWWQKQLKPNNSYKPITNTAWVRARLCNLQKRVHSTRSRK
jgi:hypothetical protein